MCPSSYIKFCRDSSTLVVAQMVVLFVLELLTILALGMLSNSPVAKAQFAGSLPACARLCATTAANAVGCKSCVHNFFEASLISPYYLSDLTDASCLCASKFFSNATLTCSSSSCPSADQTTMTAYLEDMCKSGTCFSQLDTLHSL